MTKSSLIEKLKVLEEGLPCTPESGFLGTDLDPEECSLILVPVPWEATTSYGGGTSQGPKSIMKASHQLDLEDSSFGKSYRAGIAFIEPNSEIAALNSTAKEAAQEVIAAVSERNSSPENLAIVNQAGLRVNEIVNEEVEHWLAKGKFVAVVGGDHSSPQGLIEALSKRYTEGFGILHFDAHHDLRNEYEGFKFSHASIFHNVMHEFKNVLNLVQVGIRDYSRDEKNFMIQLKDRGHCFYDKDLFDQKAKGKSFKEIAEMIVEKLPSKVYVSFDIDGLEPHFCPSTGTPVPGGLSFNEACYILELLSQSGKKVIGFDLCEVSPSPAGDEWDANVGARLLYKLCGCLLKSQRLC